MRQVKAVAVSIAFAMLFALAINGQGVGAQEGFMRDTDVKIDQSRPNTSNTDRRYPFIRYAQTFIPTDLLPVNAIDSGKYVAATGIYESLFDLFGVDEYVGRLVKTYRWVDKTHLEMVLYDYIYDSDGNHLTASDVVFSYDLLVKSGFAKSWDFVDTYRAEGPYTVKFAFKKPMNLDSFTELFVVPFMVTEAAYKKHDMSTDPIGTGPYKMTGYVTGAYIVIEARENYWQKPQLTSKLAKANVQKLQIDFLSDKSMQMIALEKGTSCATKLAATDLPNFKAGGKYAGKYNIYSFDATDTFTIMPNLSEKSIFSDKNMRLAAFYALDSKGIVAALGGPELYKACTVSCSSATGDYSSDWDKIQSYQTIYDPKLAKEYLQKAGYKGQPVVILCEEHPTKKAIAVVAQGMLQAVGIKAEIRTYAMALMNSYLSNPDGWDLYMASGGHPTYAAARVLKSLGKTYGPVKGTPVNFSTDETFQTMLSAAVTKEGYGAKATTDIMKYVLDNAYDYACVYAKEITAYDKCFADFIYKKEGSKNNKIIFFACNFYLD